MPEHFEGSLKGHFLLAMPGLLDPNFFQTVTCISEHTPEGALGLVVNRVHHSLTVGHILEELSIESTGGVGPEPVFIGGPVHVGEVFILHGPPFEWTGCLRITSNLAMSNSKDILVAIAEARGPDRFLVALGCAGWGEGQLEGEILQNAWLTGPADEEIIFTTPAEERWDAAMKRLGVDPSLLSGTAGNA
ncbi:MAG: YqgE/AlgH family protein [Desulfobacterales bacterium]|jgi:putative transcriptional regulator